MVHTKSDQMKTITLSEFTLDELLLLIGNLLESKLSRINMESQPFDEYVSRAELAKLLNISLPTLSGYTKQGWLISHKIGNRVLYNRREVTKSINELSSKKYKKTIL